MTLDDKYCAFCMGNLILLEQIGLNMKFACENKKVCPYRWTVSVANFKAMQIPKANNKLFCKLDRFKPFKDRKTHDR